MRESQSGAAMSASGLPTVFELVGIRLVSVERGKAMLEIDAGPRHWNHAGTVHGGILSTLTDAAMGLAHLSASPAQFVTIDLKVNFLARVTEGCLTATANVITCGRTPALLECDVKDAGGRLEAKASSA